jgi:hypothetical protein
LFCKILCCLTAVDTVAAAYEENGNGLVIGNGQLKKLQTMLQIQGTELSANLTKGLFHRNLTRQHCFVPFSLNAYWLRSNNSSNKICRLWVCQTPIREYK